MPEEISHKWASDPLGERPVQIMDDLLEHMPIALLAPMTLYCCDAEETVAAIVSNEFLSDFDNIPVQRTKEIVGVFERKSVCQSTIDNGLLVADAMSPLSERKIMSADASILSFVENADKQEYALLVEGNEITKIVTLSDLQKVAVRPSLFSLLTLVEMLLAEWIRLNSQDDDEWMATLPEPRQRQIRSRYERLLTENLVVDLITATMLEDKILAATHLPGFPGDAVDLEKLKAFRNSVFHHHNYAEYETNAKQICQFVRLAKRYIRLLEDAMNPTTIRAH